MDKTIFILQFFQKSHLLKMTEPVYQQTVCDLFDWLKVSDGVSHDVTGGLFPETDMQGKIIAKQDAVIAGMEEVLFLLNREKDMAFKVIIPDGQRAAKGQIIAEISGKSRDILSIERTILNILQWMSGIATETQRLVQLVEGSQSFIAATRKTPWTMLDKKAVAVGGGLTHRLSLSDGILIKDNHLEVMKKEQGLKSEDEAVKAVLDLIFPRSKNAFIEIETKTEEAALEAVSQFSRLQNSNSLAVMLDNWEPERAGEFLKKITAEYDTSSILFEASGNITENNLAAWARTGVDIISLGALTHSARAADLSLELG